VGDVYACPFVIHEQFRAGNVRAAGFSDVWTKSELFTSLREPGNPGACGSCGSYDACRGGCMAAKFFTGLELTDPDPECVFGHGETALAAKRVVLRPSSAADHSRRMPVSLSTR
jgi:radical SAM protein with 4Fe4S-binding SPASM domain